MQLLRITDASWGALKGLPFFQFCLVRAALPLTAPWLVSLVITPLLNESTVSLLSVVACIQISLFMDSEELVKPDFFSGI